MAVQLLDEDKTREVTDAELGVPDGDAETVYVLRDLTKPVYRRILKQNTTRVPNKRTHQKDDVIDYAAVQDDLLDYALSDWRGVLLRGQKVPCARDYKMRLDPVRTQAILDLAGYGEVTDASEGRSESFRQPPAVV